VLGKVFWRGGLEALGAAVADDVLLSLTRRELLRRARASTVAGETEFAFRHALVRDVAYAQIPRAARAEKHRLAAEWIARTAAARADLVAHHYLQAMELVEQTGGDPEPLREPARLALVAAGDRAVALGATPDAILLYRRALALRGGDADLLLKLAFARAEADGSGADEARQASALYEAAGDVRGLARCDIVLSRSLWLAGEAEAAREAIAAAVDQARQAGDGAVLGEALEEQARGLMTAGHYPEAIAAAEEAIALTTQHGLWGPAVHARITQATALANVGERRGIGLLEEAAEEADRLNEARALLRALNNISHIHWMAGRLEQSQEAWRRARDRTARFSFATATTWLASNGASTTLALGHWDDAATLLTEYDRVTPPGNYLEPQSTKVRAIIAYGRADPSAAAALDRLAVGLTGDPQSVRDAVEFLGLAFVFDGRMAEAVALAERIAAIDSAESSSAYPGLLGFLTGVDITHAYAADSPWQELNKHLAAGRLEEALAMLDAMGARTDAAIVRLVLARERGSEPWAAEAEAFFAEVGATRFLRELDEIRATRRSA